MKALAKRNAKLAKRPTDKDMEQLEAIEYGLQVRAAEIVGDSLLAPEVPPDISAMPEEWIARFGDSERARRAFIVAKAAWENSKEAPLFVKNAHSFLVGLMKVRAREKQPDAPQLNMTMVNMNFQLPEFPSRKVDK